MKANNGTDVGQIVERYREILTSMRSKTSLKQTRKLSDEFILSTIDDIYEYCSAQELINSAERAMPSVTFPELVVSRFRRRFGNETFASKNICDFLCSMDPIRNRSLWADIFGRFAEGSYEIDDLLFFCSMRKIVSSEIAKITSSIVGIKSSNALSKSPWKSAIAGLPPLTLQKCREIARLVFSNFLKTKNNPSIYCNNFSRASTLFVSQRSPKSLLLSQTLDHCELYNILIVVYHNISKTISSESFFTSNQQLSLVSTIHPSTSSFKDDESTVLELSQEPTPNPPPPKPQPHPQSPSFSVSDLGNPKSLDESFAFLLKEQLQIAMNEYLEVIFNELKSVLDGNAKETLEKETREILSKSVNSTINSLIRDDLTEGQNVILISQGLKDLFCRIKQSNRSFGDESKNEILRFAFDLSTKIITVSFQTTNLTF